MRTARLGLLFLLVFAFSLQGFGQGVERAPATITRGVQALAAPSVLLYDGGKLISAELIENYRQVQREKKDLNIGDFIPLNIAPSHDTGYVMSVIADKSLNTILNQPQFRESALGRTADKVEKNLKQEVSFGDRSKNEVQHKFNFQVQAFQTQAELKYSGLTNAAVLYRARSSTVAFELFEKLPTAQKQQVVLSHELRPEERVSQVSVRWDW
jgi:hypothetical protein